MKSKKASENIFKIQQIPLQKIFLDLKNPRHPNYQSEQEVITYLCRKEYVYELAQDLVANGLNPLELMAVIKTPGQETYLAAEGNRRLCALKLLEDPQLAPKDQQKNFMRLAKRWNPYHSVRSIVFDDRDAVAHWLERIHGGLQGGIGRKPWDAEQKTRFTGDRKNLMAQQLLDYAQDEGMISTEQRAKKLSVVQRFLSNPIFKDALGISAHDDIEMHVIRAKEDFDIILKKFIEDIVSGEINTRYNSQKIKEYSKIILKLEELTGAMISPTSIKKLNQINSNVGKTAPNLGTSVDIEKKENNSEEAGNSKLTHR